MQTYLANIQGWLYRLLNMNLDFILVLNVLDGNIDKFPQSSSYFGEIRDASLSRLKHSLTVTSEF